MTDEMIDREYQAGRSDLNEGIDLGIAKIFAGVRTTFGVFNRIQWSAPWNSRPHAHRRGARYG